MGQTEHRDRGPDARRVRATIERLVSDGNALACSDGTRHDLFPVAASAAEGEALRGWVVREGATRTVEVGLGYGVSALHVCEGLLADVDTAGRHVALDPSQATRFSGCGPQFLEDAGVAGMMEHRAERSEPALARLLGEGRSFDLALVDGDHRFDGVFVDLFYLGRLVRPGGVIPRASPPPASSLVRWSPVRWLPGRPGRSFRSRPGVQSGGLRRLWPRSGPGPSRASTRRRA